MIDSGYYTSSIGPEKLCHSVNVVAWLADVQDCIHLIVFPQQWSVDISWFLRLLIAHNTVFKVISYKLFLQTFICVSSGNLLQTCQNLHLVHGWYEAVEPG